MKKRAQLDFILWISSVCVCFYCGVAFLYISGYQKSTTIVLILLGLNLFSLTAGFISRVKRPYRIALTGRCLSVCLLLGYVSGTPHIALSLIGNVIVEIVLREAYPHNLIIGGCFLLASIGIRLAVFPYGVQFTLLAAVLVQLDLFFMCAFILVPGSLFTRYREDIIDITRDKERLDHMASELTRVNLQYQDLAMGAEEAGMLEERLRITRDIHDIVGYTLTNNIAMMEAATDMIRRNPLAVPSLIKAARDNAQEGLSQIRESLYRLRSQVEQRPCGLRALRRLCRIFEIATKMKVRLALGNARWEYGDAIDSAIYHLVQEALLNSFRHGKATCVTVSLWETATDITSSISDDGVGSEEIHEGIGIRGMRERVQALKGDFIAKSSLSGFVVFTRIPLEEKVDKRE